MITYTPSSWYWNVNNSNTQVFFSGSLSFVLLNDGTYNAWLALGNNPTRMDTGQNLYDVLTQQVVPSIMANGVTLTSTGTPSLNGTYPLDTVTQSQMAGILTQIANGQGLPGGGSTFMFNGISFTQDQFLAVTTALSNWTYNFNLQLGTVCESLGAAGSVPTSSVTIA